MDTFLLSLFLGLSFPALLLPLHYARQRLQSGVQLRHPEPATRAATIDPHTLGTICGLFSAFAYTCANAFLRAAAHCDPVWVSAVKAVPTVLAMTPVMIAMAYRGQRVLPPWRMLVAIAIGGLIGQLGGNISFQWALGQIGVALVVP